MSPARFKSLCPLRPVALGTKRIYVWEDVREWFHRWHNQKQNAKGHTAQPNWVDKVYGENANSSNG